MPTQPFQRNRSDENATSSPNPMRKTAKESAATGCFSSLTSGVAVCVAETDCYAEFADYLCGDCYLQGF